MEAELGAMWLNSKRKDNKLLKLIKDLELIIKEPGPVQLHVPHLKKVYTGENVDQIFSQTASVIKMAVKKARLSKEDISLTEAIQKELGMLEKTADQSIIESLILSHYAMAVHDYSAQLFEPEKDFGWDSVLVDGFDQVIDGLVGGLEGEIPIEVELGTVVRQIEVNKKQKKLIVRTTELKQHFADAVIIALPLGVLKNNSILFDPHLPREWYSALKKMGISYTNKLILEFDRVFWPKDVGVFTMATNNSSEFGYFQTWINVHFFTEKPILMGNVYGDKAKAFEQLTDEDVKLQGINKHIKEENRNLLLSLASHDKCPGSL
ncbi:hypothetical protein FSP39_019647 [Pinctada imbricata]|uniref:Amine oxidase domain-containing protein n=1 Tax=Pinctada imbricata TaxID=66713 RepID=A0AA88XWD3_PINIB|nr:hypothetical protein FSP39_019647 [Pinctada imbricata]